MYRPRDNFFFRNCEMFWVFTRLQLQSNQKEGVFGVANAPTGRSLFGTARMHGWPHTENPLLFGFIVDGSQGPMYAMGLWNSQPEGREGKKCLCADSENSSSNFFTIFGLSHV